MLKSAQIILYFLFFINKGYTQDENRIVGKYHLPNNLDIELYKNGLKYYGKIIALNGFENGQERDINNPVVSLRDNLLIDKVIIENLEYDFKNKKWINGKMYSPEKGMYFNLEILKVLETKIIVEGSKYFFIRKIEWDIINSTNKYNKSEFGK